jgi:hypothetical protein
MVVLSGSILDTGLVEAWVTSARYITRSGGRDDEVVAGQRWEGVVGFRSFWRPSRSTARAGLSGLSRRLTIPSRRDSGRSRGIAASVPDRSSALTDMVVAARRLAYHKMVLAAFPTNVQGIALYERVGFRAVGVYREQGQLDGKWVDVVIMERLL